MVDGHKKMIALFEQASVSKDAQVKAFAEKTLPALREHLKHAQHAQSTHWRGHKYQWRRTSQPRDRAKVSSFGPCGNPPCPGFVQAGRRGCPHARLVSDSVSARCGHADRVGRQPLAGAPQTVAPPEDLCADRNRQDSRREHACEVREEALGARTALDIDPGQNGSVHVRGGGNADVRLRTRVEATPRANPRTRARERR